MDFTKLIVICIIIFNGNQVFGSDYMFLIFFQFSISPIIALVSILFIIVLSMCEIIGAEGILFISESQRLFFRQCNLLKIVIPAWVLIISFLAGRDPFLICLFICLFILYFKRRFIFEGDRQNKVI